MSKKKYEGHTMAGIPISDADYDAFENNWGTKQSTIVTSLKDGKFYRLRRSACGGGCYCNASATEVPSLNFTGKILVGYAGKDLTQPNNSGAVDVYTSDLEIEIHDDLQPDHQDNPRSPVTFWLANVPVYEVIENGQSVGFEIRFGTEPVRRAVQEFHKRHEKQELLEKLRGDLKENTCQQEEFRDTAAMKRAIKEKVTDPRSKASGSGEIRKEQL